MKVEKWLAGSGDAEDQKDLLRQALRKSGAKEGVPGPDLPPQFVSAWGKVANEPGSYAKTNWQINSLQFFAFGVGVTLKTLQKAGLQNLTRHVFEEAQSLARSGGGRVPVPSLRGGRRPAPVASIQKNFEDASKPTRATNQKGEVMRALSNPIGAVVDQIVGSGFCCRSTYT